MLIQILRTQNDQYGYNISPGGTGGNQNPTKYVKQFDLDGKFIAEYKSQVDASKAIGCSLRGIRSACDNHWSIYGYQIRLANEPDPGPYVKETQRTILKFNLDGTLANKYLSIVRAAQEENINISNLYGALSSTSKCHLYNDYIWVYEDIFNEKDSTYINSIIQNISHIHGEKVVYQLSPDYKLINKFSSIKSAAISVNKSRASVSDACCGRSHTCAGYIWMFENDYKNFLAKEVA